jgi:hypothetical protein
LNTLLTLSVFPNTASNDIQQHVNSAISADVDNDSQSDCHSDLHSCARVFRSIMIWEWCNFANMFSQSLQFLTCWFCSIAAAEMGYFTTYEFQCYNIMSLKFISQVFTCAVL